MFLPSMRWYSESRHLLFIVISVVAAVALSYDYVTTERIPDGFFIIVGAGLLLAVLVIVPVVLFDRRRESE